MECWSVADRACGSLVFAHFAFFSFYLSSIHSFIHSHFPFSFPFFILPLTLFPQYKMPQLWKRSRQSPTSTSPPLPLPRPRKKRHQPINRPSNRQQAVLDRQNPLLIPEILLNIGDNLDRSTLAPCVCRLWNSTLSPLVWSNLKHYLGIQKQQKRKRGKNCPLFNLVKKHAIQVQTVTLALYAGLERTLPSNTTNAFIFPKKLTCLKIKLKWYRDRRMSLGSDRHGG